MALEFAIRSGLIGRLANCDNPLMPTDLCAILQRAEVVAGSAPCPDFLSDWLHHRDELTARAAILRYAASDITQHGDSLWTDLPAFMQQFATFRCFDYRPAADGQSDPATQSWVNYVSALTETPSLLPHLMLPLQGTVLEIGGNSGRVARHILTRHLDLTMTVLDLPVVCRTVRADPRNQAFGARLTFAAGDLRRTDLATVAGSVPDVILLKSVLHDWPDKEAATLIQAALNALPPSGRLIIAERGAFAAASLPNLSMRAVGNSVFSPFYRDPAAYVAMIHAQSCRATIDCKNLMLDMAWHVLTITLPAYSGRPDIDKVTSRLRSASIRRNRDPAWTASSRRCSQRISHPTAV
jgi:SAM-dependent methyltransferase